MNTPFLMVEERTGCSIRESSDADAKCKDNGLLDGR